MAGVTTALILAAAAASAYSANRQAHATKEGVKYAQNESERQRQYEEEKIQMQRNSPGAKFAPFGFDSILSVFGHSMAGKMSHFNETDARVSMGLLNKDGSKGPLWQGYNAFMGTQLPYPVSPNWMNPVEGRSAVGGGGGGGMNGGQRDGSLSPTQFFMPSGSGTTGGGATFGTESDMGEGRSKYAS